MGRGPYFARQIRYNELYLLKHQHLPPPKAFVRHGHHTLLDNEALLHDVRVYLATQALGTVNPRLLAQHVNNVILPALGIRGAIADSTAQRWLRSKLGYECKEARKGLYVDGHERPDVVEERKEFIAILNGFEWYVGRVQHSISRSSDLNILTSLMATYDDESLDRIPPTLQSGQKEHVLIMQDETIFHTNEYRRRMWLAPDQQPIRKKGNGRAIHISDFISETTGRIKLSEEQIADQLKRSVEQRLPAFEARKIIYPGKGFDAWWDLSQLIDQIKITIQIFELTHPNCVAVFTFDRSSAHEGFAEDALNVNNMNINPGGKQRKLRDTVIPLNNPDPAPGEEDTRGQVQQMTFPDDHADPKLRGQAKGMRIVLQERKSVWNKFTTMCKERKSKIVGKCASCTKSETRKDAERRIALAESMGQDDAVSAEDTTLIDSEAQPNVDDQWCCINRVLSLQDDFRTERPLVQSIIEDAGHICLFLPRFHCELNPIEMLWGYGKYRMCISRARDTVLLRSTGYRTLSDGRFATAKRLVPQCLDSCDLITIRKFFRKAWRYIDAYRYWC